MNERITQFLQAQKVATVCCVDEENNPYCFNCFYAFDETRLLLYFKTSAATRHAHLLASNPTVAGTVQPDKLNTLAVRGIQFTGQVMDPDKPIAIDASASYHKRFPFAVAMNGDVLTIKLTAIKMTDNTLSFGKKLLWELEPAHPTLVPNNIVSN
ncbi:pyridoxamine 5'-phosphate oxidase family protein [Flavisolibacter nicotianae]|uniref:pyridoxamine 5'-phosphate oxidase family protein n=1 Tax=Flavisolibacter nicotianae TaxID=2364882 RepID=UPI0013C4BC0F|nr:pyridoxamine 5'-phosphate oxidase family protein [Flavisolibacter nicotianae]